MLPNLHARRCHIATRGARWPVLMPAVLMPAVLACLSVGCAGAKATIAAPNSEVPISMSRGIPDDAGHTLLLGKELKPVGKVYAHYRRWSWLYGAVKGKKPIDISDDINADVHAAGGEAVTEFSVRSAHCAANLMWPLMWLPIWPGCVEIDVKGTVVKRAAPPAAPAPAPANAAGGEL